MSMPANVRDAIRSLVEYSRPSEYRDWLENGQTEDHIFKDIELIDAWLAESEKS
jgi:hypothetical protein